MASKELVYEILSAMKEATNKPVTIKHKNRYWWHGNNYR